MVIDVPHQSVKQHSETQQNSILVSSNGTEPNVSQNSSQNGMELDVSNDHSSSPSMEYDNEFDWISE